MADGARGDPCVVRRNRIAVPLSLCDQAAVAAGNAIVIGNNEKLAQSSLEIPAFDLTPSILLGTEIELADSDERNGQQSSLQVRLIVCRKWVAFHHVRDDVRIEDDALHGQEFS